MSLHQPRRDFEGAIRICEAFCRPAKCEQRLGARDQGTRIIVLDMKRLLGHGQGFWMTLQITQNQRDIHHVSGVVRP